MTTATATDTASVSVIDIPRGTLSATAAVTETIILAATVSASMILTAVAAAAMKNPRAAAAGEMMTRMLIAGGVTMTPNGHLAPAGLSGTLSRLSVVTVVGSVTTRRRQKLPGTKLS